MTTYNGHNNIWELPFGQPAELELQTEVGSLRLVPVEPGQAKDDRQQCYGRIAIILRDLQ